jgi:hypothetical protein
MLSRYAVFLVVVCETRRVGVVVEIIYIISRDGIQTQS